LSYARTAAIPDVVEQKPHAGSVPSPRARLVTMPGTTWGGQLRVVVMAAAPGGAENNRHEPAR
jgi:hypothetical protein